MNTKITYQYHAFPMLKGTALSLMISFSLIQPVHARPSQLPLSITYAVEPNVMILFDTSGSMGDPMTDANGNNSTRIRVGKDAINGLITSIEGVRFGLASFHNNAVDSAFGSRGDGASIANDAVLSSDDADLASMVTSINNLTASGTTPVQEAYYDITRYYRSLSPYFGNFPSSYADPIRYRCQANSIIVVTDGDPQRDWDHRSLTSCTGGGNTYGETFKGVDDRCNQTAIDLGGGIDPDANWGGLNPGPSLPDWDGINNAHPAAYSDGTCAGDVYSAACRDTGSLSKVTNLYLDDFAKFATDIDLKNSGIDDAGKSFQDPNFEVQNISTHTIGFKLTSQMLEDAASDGYGNGTYKKANSAQDIKDALESAILTAVGGQGVGAGATQASISLDQNGETNVYVTEYDSELWSGKLI